MARKHNELGPSGKVDHREPEAVIPGVVEAIGLALKMGKDTFTIGKDVYGLVKKEPPLTFKIILSHIEGKSHLVQICVANNTDHGIYIEKIDFLRISRRQKRTSVNPSNRQNSAHTPPVYLYRFPVKTA